MHSAIIQTWNRRSIHEIRPAWKARLADSGVLDAKSRRLYPWSAADDGVATKIAPSNSPTESIIHVEGSGTETTASTRA